MRARGSVVRWGRIFVALLLALPLAGLVIFSRTERVAAANVDVSIQGLAYHGPNGNGSFTIVAGTTVTWTNNDFTNHTATSDQQVFDTGVINTPGAFSYHCIFHSAIMTGTITVIVAPTVTSVTPPAGVTTGGTSVTITGTNFQNGATVSFGGAMATNVAFVDSNTLTATTPAHAAGTVDVTVTNPDTGTGTGTGVFTYAVVSTLPGAKPAGPAAGSNPNALPGLVPSVAPAGSSGQLPPRRSLGNAGGTSGAANTGAPAPAPLPPRR
jgi:plastocyanin